MPSLSIPPTPSAGASPPAGSTCSIMDVGASAAAVTVQPTPPSITAPTSLEYPTQTDSVAPSETMLDSAPSSTVERAATDQPTHRTTPSGNCEMTVDANDDDDTTATSNGAASSNSNSNSNSHSGALARSLSIPAFPSPSRTNSSAGGGGSSLNETLGHSPPASSPTHSTPSKRSKVGNSNGIGGGAGGHSRSAHASPASAPVSASKGDGDGSQTPSALALTAPAVAVGTPQSYVRTSSSSSSQQQQQQQQQAAQSSYQHQPTKRRNSTSTVLQQLHGNGNGNGTKPPTYPSTPSTPVMNGRNGGARNGHGHGSTHHSSPSSSESTPPTTPPMVPCKTPGGTATPSGALPMNLMLMPRAQTVPRTPALAPERSINITDSHGRIVRQVSIGGGNSGEKGGNNGVNGNGTDVVERSSMEAEAQRLKSVEQVVLPPPATSSSVHTPTQRSLSQQSKHPHHYQHSPVGTPSTPRERSMRDSQSTQNHHHQHNHQRGGSRPPSIVLPNKGPGSTIHVAPITPVKHLVKLSSMSSLASLVSTTPAPPPKSNHQTTPNMSSISVAASSNGSTSRDISPTMSPVLGPRGVLRASAPSSPMSSPLNCMIRPPQPPLPAPQTVPPTYLILDIDETIHINAHAPCAMMNERGLDLYQRIISSHAKYRHVSYQAKSNLTKILQAALQAKRTVEEKTGALLNALQEANIQAPHANNIRIFGLTARFTHMANTTRKELLKLGIDLEKSSPFTHGVRKKWAMTHPPPHTRTSSPQPDSAAGTGTGNGQNRSATPSPILHGINGHNGSSMSTLSLPSSLSALHPSPSAQEAPLPPDVTWSDSPIHGTDARYVSGVIYTNACEKGPVLARFLKFLWNLIEEENVEIVSNNMKIMSEYQTAVQAANAHASANANTNASGSGSVMHGSPKRSGDSSPLLGGSSLMGGSGNGVGGVGSNLRNATTTSSTPPEPSTPTSPYPMTLLAAASQSAQSRAQTQAQAQAQAQSQLHGNETPKQQHQQQQQRRNSKSASYLALPPPIPLQQPQQGSENGGSVASPGSRRSSTPPSPSLSPLSPPRAASPAGSSSATQQQQLQQQPQQPQQLQAISMLPTRLIFIDDRLQNCLSVYEYLSGATLFDSYYNDQSKRNRWNHVPKALEVYTCHYCPVELAAVAPTNQTHADAAATAAAAARAAAASSPTSAATDTIREMELIEYQIHHFLTTTEILSDPVGKTALLKSRQEEGERLKKGQMQEQQECRTSHQKMGGGVICVDGQQQQQQVKPSSPSTRKGEWTRKLKQELQMMGADDADVHASTKAAQSNRSSSAMSDDGADSIDKTTCTSSAAVAPAPDQDQDSSMDSTASPTSTSTAPASSDLMVDSMMASTPRDERVAVQS